MMDNDKEFSRSDDQSHKHSFIIQKYLTSLDAHLSNQHLTDIHTEKHQQPRTKSREEFHLSSLQRIFSNHEIKKLGQLDYFIEIRGANYQIMPGIPKKYGQSSSRSLWLAISQALLLADDNNTAEKGAKHIKHLVLKYIERNWEEYREKILTTYRKELEPKKGSAQNEFKHYKRLKSCSVVELCAASELFKFDFCLIMAPNSGSVYVLNKEHEESNLTMYERTILTKFYFFQSIITTNTVSLGTGNLRRSASSSSSRVNPETKTCFTYSWLKPTFSLFISPEDGMYPCKIKKVFHIDLISRAQSKTTQEKRTSKQQDKYFELEPYLESITTLVFSYKSEEFIYKDLGILPQHSLFTILAELFYNSCLNGKQVKEKLDKEWLKYNQQQRFARYQSKLLPASFSTFYNGHYQGDEKYLELAANVYGFNYMLIRFNCEGGGASGLAKVVPKIVHRKTFSDEYDDLENSKGIDRHQSKSKFKLKPIPWYFFLVKIATIRKPSASPNDEWFLLHLMDDVATVLKKMEARSTKSSLSKSATAAAVKSEVVEAQLLPPTSKPSLKCPQPLSPLTHQQPMLLEIYEESVKRFQENLRHILFEKGKFNFFRSNKKLSQQQTLLIKPKYYSNQLLLNHPTVIQKTIKDKPSFVEFLIEEDGTKIPIYPGDKESNWVKIDHKYAGLADYVHYFALSYQAKKQLRKSQSLQPQDCK